MHITENEVNCGRDLKAGAIFLLAVLLYSSFLMFQAIMHNFNSQNYPLSLAELIVPFATLAVLFALIKIALSCFIFSIKYDPTSNKLIFGRTLRKCQVPLTEIESWKIIKYRIGYIGRGTMTVGHIEISTKNGDIIKYTFDNSPDLTNFLIKKVEISPKEIFLKDSFKNSLYYYKIILSY